MESATITPEISEAVEAAPNGNNGFRGYLSLVCMSAVLEQGGQTTWPELRDRLKDYGVLPDRSSNAVQRTLRKTSRVSIEDDVVTATEKGIDYVAENTEHIEGSYERVKVKRPKFTPMRYQVLTYSREKGLEGGWVMGPNLNGDSVVNHLADVMDTTQRNMSRSLYDYRQEDLFDEVWNEDGTKMTNLRLNEKGKADLKTMQEIFPEEIRRLEARRTIAAMRSEIDNMRWELDEGLEAFDDISGWTDDEVIAETERLTGVMSGLERRLDSRPA